MYEEDLLDSAEVIEQTISQDVRDAVEAFDARVGSRAPPRSPSPPGRQRGAAEGNSLPPAKRASGQPDRRGADAGGLHSSQAAGSGDARPGAGELGEAETTLAVVAPPRGASPRPGYSDTAVDPGRQDWPSQAPAEGGRSFAGWHREFPPMQISQELEDLVSLVTRADRACRENGGPGAGHFVWLAYNACNSKGRKEQPSYGSHLFAFDRGFVADFLPHLRSQAPGHADLILRGWLKVHASTVGASYLWPAAGACETHESACQKGLGIRETTFGKRWVGNGFRGTGGPRYLRQWVPSQAPAYLTGPINWDEPGFEWRTARPPLSWNAPCYQQELWRRWWLDWDLGWKGPDPPRRYWWVRPLAPGSLDNPEPGAGSGGAGRRARRPQEEVGMRALLLIVDPNGQNRQLDGGYSPISRVAEQLVIDMPDFHEQLLQGLSARVSRERRQAIAMYLRRFFVDEAVVKAGGYLCMSILCDCHF